MMETYSINGWSEFQHYKDRNPPWVKLHGKTLTSPTWLRGTDRQRMVQLASILLAARYDNAIPLDWEVIQPAAGLKCTENEFREALAYLEQNAFITIATRKQRASKALAKCSPSRGENIEQVEKIPPVSPRAQKLSSDWKPTLEDRVYARSKNLTDTEIDEESIAFVRYWTGPDAKNAAKKDWHRTWCGRIDDVAHRIISRRSQKPKEIQNEKDPGISSGQWRSRAVGYLNPDPGEQPFWLTSWGPKPDQEGCLCPAEIIQEARQKQVA